MDDEPSPAASAALVELAYVVGAGTEPSPYVHTPSAAAAAAAAFEMPEDKAKYIQVHMTSQLL